MAGRVNHKVCLILTILMVLGLTAQLAWAKYGGGSGTPEDPYLIYTAAQMNSIGVNRGDWNKHFRLMADIDLGEFTGNSFKRIGIGWATPFTGVFDGNGHKISNFTYHSTMEYSFVGIFGYVAGENAHIKNLVLISPDVNAVSAAYVASLVGRMEDGTVTNCSVEQGTVSGKGSGVGGLLGFCSQTAIADCHSIATVSCAGSGSGGLVGVIYKGTMTDCSSAGSVSGERDVGGLVGDLSGGEVLNCRSQANVIGVDYIGGLVGYNDVAIEIEPIIINPSLISCCTASGNVSGISLVGGLVGLNWCAISDCYATGNVSGSNDVGGLVGDNISAGIDGVQTDAVISNCYSIGRVSGSNSVGGLVGRHWASGPIEPITINSFWDIQTSGQTSSPGGGIGKTTAQMKTKSTFTSAGWDFTSPVWVIDEYGDYPHLRWEVNILYVPEYCPTIQGAIDTAVNGDTVIVAPGTYTGTGNRDIDFKGKAITVRSIDPNDPDIVAGTIIDCDGTEAQPHRGFYFHSHENAGSVLNGLTITNGYATYGGGIYCSSSSPTITNCTFTGNVASFWGGGGIFCYNSSPTITNCIFTGNSVYGDGNEGGGMLNVNNSSPMVIGCTFNGNSAYFGGGMCNEESSPTLTNCIFTGNSATSAAGMYNYYNSSPMVKNCIFYRNSTPNNGGGMYNAYNSNPMVIGCTLSRNLAGWGGGMFIWDSNPTVTNCIIWANTPEIYVSNSTPIITYSNIRGGWAGTGNIKTDPLFINAAGGDLHLLPNSPCINVGNPDFIPEPNETDIDAEPRVMLGMVDMGADEFNPFVIDFIVVNKRRIGRTIFEYDCVVTLTNISRFAVRNVQLEIVKASKNMVIIDPNVTFGDIEIGPGESATSFDMCTFQVDRSEATESAEIIWKSACEIVEGALGMQDIVSGVYLLQLDNIPGDITGNGRVDFEDLKVLADQWLQPPSIPSADIAPPPSGDNFVNFLDFAILAENWLQGADE